MIEINEEEKSNTTTESTSQQDLKRLKSRVTTLEKIYKTAKKELRNARIEHEEAEKAAENSSIHTFVYHGGISIFEGKEKGRMYSRNPTSPLSLSASERRISSSSKEEEFQRSSDEIQSSVRRRHSDSKVLYQAAVHRGGDHNIYDSNFEKVLESISERRSSFFTQRRKSYTKGNLGFHKKNIDTRVKLKELCSRVEKMSEDCRGN